MALDRYTEVTRRSWGSKLGGSFRGVIGGVVIAALGIVLLWWNEGRAVSTARALARGAKIAVSVPGDRIEARFEGQLVHVVGQATTPETLVDPLCGAQAQALALQRTVEMYQWQESSHSETRKKLGGGEETVTTYTYEKKWADEPIDSRKFKQPEGHANPGTFPMTSETWRAQTVMVGAFTLSPSLASRISTFELLPPPDPGAVNAAVARGRRAQLHGNYLFFGNAPTNPPIGDMRVSFAVVRPVTVSVVAQQSAGALSPYPIDRGQTLQLLEVGVHSAEAMFKAAEKKNTFLTWLLRVVGFVLIFVGFNALFRPLVVLGDVVPLVGNLLAKGAVAVAFLLAAIVSFVVIAVAWLAHRPLLAGALLGGAALALVLLLARKKKKVVPPPLPSA